MREPEEILNNNRLNDDGSLLMSLVKSSIVEAQIEAWNEAIEAAAKEAEYFSSHSLPAKNVYKNILKLKK